MFECEYCAKAYVSALNLRRHLTMAHESDDTHTDKDAHTYEIDDESEVP